MPRQSAVGIMWKWKPNFQNHHGRRWTCGEKSWRGDRWLNYIQVISLWFLLRIRGMSNDLGGKVRYFDKRWYIEYWLNIRMIQVYLSRLYQIAHVSNVKRSRRIDAFTLAFGCSGHKKYADREAQTINMQIHSFETSLVQSHVSYICLANNFAWTFFLAYLAQYHT